MGKMHVENMGNGPLGGASRPKRACETSYRVAIRVLDPPLAIVAGHPPQPTLLRTHELLLGGRVADRGLRNRSARRPQQESTESNAHFNSNSIDVH